MKKLFTAVLMLILFALPAYASGAEITVEIPNRGALMEEQYYVTVSVADNPGFASLQLELFYDADVMDCVQVRPGEVVCGMLSDTNPHAGGAKTSAILSVAGFSDTEKNGTLVTFIFEAPGSGDPDFEVSLTELRNSSGKNVVCRLNVVNEYGSTAELPNDKEDGNKTEDGREQEKTEDSEIKTEVSVEVETDDRDDEEENRHNRDDRDDRKEPDDRDDRDDREEDRETVGDWYGEPEIVPDDPTPSDPLEGLPDAFRDEMMKPVGGFADVNAGHWASDLITEAASRGVISGYPDGTFHPDRTMNRAEFVTVLWNMAGKPDSNAPLPFSDVKEDDWFRTQAAWAYETGCINGVTESEFRPYGTVTRVQAAVILYRYIGSPGGSYRLDFFADQDEIPSYALDAVQWALSAGVLTGVDDTHLKPLSYATRAQLSAMTVRYISYVQYVRYLQS